MKKIVKSLEKRIGEEEGGDGEKMGDRVKRALKEIEKEKERGRKKGSGTKTVRKRKRKLEKS